MIQSYRLDEAGFRGGRDFNHDQKGNNDLLNLTRPDVVSEICNAYLDAGADMWPPTPSTPTPSAWATTASPAWRARSTSPRPS